MVHPFRFGVQTGPFDDPQLLQEFARKIEDQGYAELFSYDHVGAVDPFLPLMLAASATEHLRVGPLVINNEFHNPVLLARSAATLDVLSGGRCILGMGTGYMQWEHDAADIALRAPGPRVTRFEESIAALRSLLDSGSVECDGEHITLKVEDMGFDPPRLGVPILIGGHGKRVVSIAGRRANMFQFTGLTHDPETGQPSAGGFAREIIAERSAWLQDAAGDRYDTIELSTLTQGTKVGAGAEDLRDAMAGRIGADPSLIDDTPFAFFGSQEQIIEKLYRLRDEFGIHHVVVRDPDDFAPIVASLAGS